MTMLMWQKSPQGRQVPSAFLTMCRGDDQGLSDRRTIPSFSSCRNYALAAANFSASSRRKREAMGGPEVLMWCTSINQKTPARKLVHDVHQLPRGDGVQTPPGY